MENKTKKDSRRSNAYPSITLKEAIEITDFIHKNSGYSFLKLEDISKLFNKSTGNMSQKVGSAVQYGLLELKSGTGYRPSDLFKKIIKPINDFEKESAMIEAFKFPKLYGELLDRFNNASLPSEIILPNILERDHNIFDDAAKKASQVFLENIDSLGLKNNHNELVLDKNNNDGNHEKEIQDENSKTEEIIPKNQTREEQSTLLKIEIGLTEDKKAIIFYPNNLTNVDIEIMKLQLNVLEKIVEFKQKPEIKPPVN